MVRWYPDLFLDQEMEKHKKKYMKKIEKGKISGKACYLITLSSNTENLFDIMSFRELWFLYNRSRELYVIGLAANMENALAILENIVKTVLSKDEAFQIHDYFNKEDFVER